MYICTTYCNKQTKTYMQMLNSINNHPHLILWLTMPIIFMMTIISSNKMLDLQLHDTYFVFNRLHISIILCLLLALSGGAHYLLKEHQLISWMTSFHVITTVLLTVYIGSLSGSHGFIALAIIALLLLTQVFFILNIGFSNNLLGTIK